MKFKTINWKQHPDYQEITQGFVGKQELFTITSNGKKEPNFELQSACPKSDTFHYCTTLKKLGDYRTKSLAELEGKLYWENFTNGLLHNEEEEIEESVTNETSKS